VAGPASDAPVKVDRLGELALLRPKAERLDGFAEARAQERLTETLWVVGVRVQNGVSV
jgi:hypothetical protein